MNQHLQFDHFAAQKEEFFADHWIETPAFHRAAKPELPIVFGAKGCGKSALARYVVDVRADRKVSCRRIDLTELRHRRIISQLKVLVDKIEGDDTTVLSNYWRHLLLVCFLFDVSVTIEPDDDASDGAIRMIRAALSGIERPPSPTRAIVGLLLKAIEAINEFLIVKKPSSDLVLANGLTHSELDTIERFPEDQSFVDACLAAAGLLSKHARHCCIVIDGLDVVSNADREAHPIVLAAIIKAVKRLSLDRSINDALSVKVLIPRELFFAVEDRDLDHYVTLQASLTWEPQTLFALLDRRVAAACRRAGSDCTGLDSALPAKLPDGERTFDHLIRHSMYRPRQLLVYLKAIFDRAMNGAVESDDVIHAVRATSTDLSNYFLQEHQYKYPGLKAALDSLSGLASVVTLKQVVERLGAPVRELLEMLYDSGSIGIIEESPIGVPRDPSGSCRRVGVALESISCEFVYKPGARPFMLPGLPDETLIAIHPMLHRRFGIAESRDYVIG